MKRAEEGRTGADTGRHEEVTRQKLRIAAWTQGDWAFGRIARDLQRHLGAEFELQIFDWSSFHSNDAFRSFDVIYIPVWDHVLKFREFYPGIAAERICFSVHCRAELFHYDMAQARLVNYNEATIEQCDLSGELLDFLRSQKLISVVSPELCDLLKDKYRLENLWSTTIGVDLELFSPNAVGERSDREPLKVVHTLPRKGVPREVHGYDPKRSWIVAEAEKRLAGANVRFIFAEERLPLADMPNFYRKGDLHVCVSHAEGLPTVGQESVACGLAQISTPVGVMPSIVRDGGTGFLLQETEPGRIVDELCERIHELERDRKLLRAMKERAVAFRSRLAWERRIGAWRNFFSKVVEASQKPVLGGSW